MPILLAIIRDDAISKEDELKKVADFLRQDLMMSGQLEVTCQEVCAPRSTEDIAVLCKSGYSLVIFIELLSDEGGFSWRLYDASSLEMVKGKKYKKRGSRPAWWAHNIADEVWPELLGGSSSFSSQLVFVRKKSISRTLVECELCVCDINGSHCRTVVKRRRIALTPTWQPDQFEPGILFSEIAATNVRVLKTDLAGNLAVAFDEDGTTSGVSYAAKGDMVAYCRSGEIWVHTFDKEKKRGVHTKIISESHACSSPSLFSTGDLVYGFSGKVYLYTAADKKKRILSSAGYAVAPHAHEGRRMVVYSRKIKGVMQLCCYDLSKNTEQQITTTPGDKTDAKWSPCGNWVVYCHEEKKTQRIAIVNPATKETLFISAAKEHCAYPDWSPNFLGGLD